MNNLNHGNYKLTTYSINKFSLKSNTIITSFKIVIPIYKREIFRYILFILLLFFIVSFYVLYKKNQNHKKENYLVKIENENTNLKLLKAQLNPHFIFNCLSTLKGLIYFDKKKLSLDYIDEFSLFLRNSITNNNSNINTLINEIDSIKNYIKLENIRLDNKIKLKTHINENMFYYTLPINILQIFIENAIIHGLNNSKDLEITLKIYDFVDFYQISIKNNGFPISNNKNNHESFAIKSIEQRLNFFNKKKFIPNIIIKNHEEGVLCIINIKKQKF
jgi:LytS/YehU family sensor histidine kinase